jgi:2-polyprenyl-6-methoxyphenol hydroxylase-like FAD-dependent oxidoreductase
MNIGIQDAVALAARLTAVIRDGAAETHLDGYEAQRRPIAAGVVAFTPPVDQCGNDARRRAPGSA